MTGLRPLPPGTRALQWGSTALVAAALGIVLARVIRCLGDDLCTFATGALKTAVFAFVGGPFLVLMVWLIPALARRAEVRRRMLGTGVALVAAGVACVAVGLALLPGGGPAVAVLPSLGPGLVLGGALAAARGSEAPDPPRS